MLGHRVVVIHFVLVQKYQPHFNIHPTVRIACWLFRYFSDEYISML